MALFGRDYDRDFGARRSAWDRGYDRTYRSDWNRGDRDNRFWGGASRYDREMGASGYDRGYKSRWQTDFGDPFGDRTSRTPMRMIRGEYEGGYDRGYRGENRYGRDFYEANPMGYEPYSGRRGTWSRGYDRGYRGSGRGRGGYDSGWF